MTEERAILAGVCFWGVEELIRHLPGVMSTTVGYTGGTLSNPTYEDIKKQRTGHAEAVEVVFDSTKLPYRKLLEFLFQIHDPTTKDRQGNDIGSSYRSAIFYIDNKQKKEAEDLIAAMTNSHKWPGRIATEIVPAGVFYKAEGYHQDYLQNNPNGYNCHFIRQDWKID